MKSGCCLAMGRLPATLMILGMALLMTACSSSDDSKTVMDGMMPGGNGDGAMTELGEWNTLAAGSLDISDENDMLRAYYDSAGGHVVADAPVQPAGTGTAAWTGMWSGKVDYTNEDLASWNILRVNPSELEALGGDARITAYFGNGGVEAELSYQEVGLEAVSFTELTSDRVPVTDGRFAPDANHTSYTNVTVVTPIGPAETTFETTGTFTGAGAFGGAGAEGVVGYLGGNLSLSYEQAPGQISRRSLGTLQTVFYGSKGTN